MRKAPDFWWRKGWSWQAFLLILPSFLYGRISGGRMLQKPRGSANIPVICIGNFVLGGVGKTPFALRLAERLTAEGYNPGFLLRGYGGRAKGPLSVDLNVHDAEAVGDEALLLASKLPTVVSADRLDGAECAEGEGIDLLIMDDGFQNPALEKDLSIALVDASTGLGNGHCIPAGPLRAPMDVQMVKTDVLVRVGDGDADDEVVHMAARKALPMFHARLRAAVQDELRERPLCAFAGIGRPAKFFDTLRQEGLDVAKTLSFADHHEFTESEAETLLKAAEAEDLQLVTTAKDMARLQSARHEIFRWLVARTQVLSVAMEIDDEDRLVGIIRESIRSRVFKQGA
ncbi:tetraacyldisaccharide 4'-kinase [Roseibium polysiphoniae]|uniref:Tetraacyldisaccharide 4'-kinase n=1 Tax=Roseibium polysiphoniae TaxID=2571221 RepID=A0ABR9CDU7_9HYPH|nr:tetraacyldisaccharide 4'-kinase [Roseibium polysiphoniae]MBD8878027.1 tetraacyldisaccharide 4'-kinase [Roseibium polysiphoniae]